MRPEGPDVTEDLSPIAAGRSALTLIDAVLARRPHKDDQALSLATKRLCLLRESLMESAGAGDGAARERLERLNAILSIVAAAHFPLGPPPWDALAGARDWLAPLVSD